MKKANHVSVLLTSLVIIALECLTAFTRASELTGQKNFDEITIPIDVSPDLLIEDNQLKMKAYALQATPNIKVIITKTDFKETGVDDDLIQLNIEATIRPITENVKHTHQLNKLIFKNARLIAHKFSFKSTEPGQVFYEFFTFNDQDSIWWINFVGQGESSDIVNYAEAFMKKVSFTSSL